MKRYLLSAFLCTQVIFLMAQPGSWEQKSSLGWNSTNGPTGRYGTVAFSIGNFGYIGTGYDGKSRKDFWQYDPVADSWTQKADFGGQARDYAIGFSIGGKGYLGLGNGPDIWEYDTATNSWTQKGDFPGGARISAAAFCIGSKGYVGTGITPNGWGNDFWEYDPVADKWTQKASFGGDARGFAFGFSIGGKGYIGAGNNGDAPSRAFRQDFWEYDPQTDHWTRKADFGGGSRTQATCFNIGNRAFVGLGFYFMGTTNYNDFWEYDPASDSWMARTIFPGAPRNGAAGFSIGGNGYIVSGWDGVNDVATISIDGAYKNDCWKFDTVTGDWSEIASFGVAKRTGAIGFSIGGKGYIGMGAMTSGSVTDFWEYDTSANSWSQKADFPTTRDEGIGFSIGNKGYAGLGFKAGYYFNDFWEFDPVLNTWTSKSDFAGSGRIGATAFSIGNEGYVGLGQASGAFLNDFWSYNPASDSWIQKSNIGGIAKSRAAGFSIGNKGYVVGGYNATPLHDSTFWEYDPATDHWTQKANFGGSSRVGAIAFSIDSMGYFGTGYSFGRLENDFWQYDPKRDSWTQQTPFRGGGRSFAVGFSIGGRGYIGTGGDGNSLFSDFWEYATQGVIRTTIGDYSATSTCPVVSGTDFTWNADSVYNLVLGINPNNNNLGTTCWGIRIVTPGTYRNSFGWFRASQQLFGAYLTRNFLVKPANQPNSAVTMRLYCTERELTDFINYFNIRYGTAYTENDIRIMRYDGINQDLDPGNNSNIATDYTIITPTAIGTYGASNAYRFFEFSTSNFSEFYITLSSLTAPLAVKFINFSAVYDNGICILRWQTAQEENSSYFTIQRSTDGTQFTTIGTTPASGNSTWIRNYSFTDMNAAAIGVNTLYYRLIETDLDNNQMYSKIAIVSVASTNNDLTVMPIPASSVIRLKLKSIKPSNKALLTIMDITGRIIENRNIIINKGETILPLSISFLSAGEYIVAVTSNDTHWQAKFIKQ